jgi:serine protease
VRLALLALALAASPAAALKTERLEPAGALSASARPLEVVSERVLVRFSSGADKAAALSAIGASLISERPSRPWALASLPAGMKVASALSALRGAPGIGAVEPDRAYRLTRVPNDPLVRMQYHLSTLDAFSAWEYETGGSTRVTIAVIDSGIDGPHPDLSAKLVGTSRFCDPGPDKTIGSDNSPCADETLGRPVAACNHATRVAGAAAAVSDNGLGVAGLSWGARLISYRVFREVDCGGPTADCSDSACATDDWAIADAIDDLASLQNSPATGRLVVNMSLGGSDAACSSVVQTAITSAKSKSPKIVFVASAGNGYPNTAPGVNSPANCAGVIPVGATDSNNLVASFSSRGPWLAQHGVVAPGVNVVTCDAGGGTTGSATGTSFSSPITAGVAALVLARRPDFTDAQVSDTLRASAMGIGASGLAAAGPMGNSSGAGLVNAFRAMRQACGALSGWEGDEKAIAFPNPFCPPEHGMAVISVPKGLQGANLKIKIYTVDGRQVRDLGAKTSWDGRNEQGAEVASGVYLFLVKTDNGAARGRLAVVH